MERKYSPGIIWGQHRTSELLPLAIKDRLVHDSHLQTMTVVEFEPYQLDDYIELLFLRAKAFEEGRNADFLVDYSKQQAWEYVKRLRDMHGHLLFNLHESYGQGYDIEFRVQDFVERDTHIKEYIDDTTSEFPELRVNVDIYPKQLTPGFELSSPDSLVVEFSIPEIERLIYYPNQKTEQLVKQFVRVNKHHLYKVVDTTDPLFANMVDKYSEFMKIVLLGLTSMKQ